MELFCKWTQCLCFCVKKNRKEYCYDRNMVPGKTIHDPTILHVLLSCGRKSFHHEFLRINGLRKRELITATNITMIGKLRGIRNGMRVINGINAQCSEYYSRNRANVFQNDEHKQIFVHVLKRHFEFSAMTIVCRLNFGIFFWVLVFFFQMTAVALVKRETKLNK